MLNKSQYRAKSAMRRPMSDVSNEVYDNNQARFLKKEASNGFEGMGSLDRLLVVRSDLSDLISQIDNLVAQAVKQKEISRKGYQEIESFIGFLSGIFSSLKPWFVRLQEALASTTTVTSKDQTKSRGTPFPEKTKLTSKTDAPKNNFTVSQSLANRSAVPSKSQTESHLTPYHCKKTHESLLASKTDSMQLDLLVSPSPLVSWRADHCTAVDGGKQLFLLTPLQKSQLEVSKALLPTKPLINEQDTNTNEKHENNIRGIVRISEQERETGFRQTPKAVLPAQTILILPDFSTVKTHERHRKTGAPTTCSRSNLRFCSKSKDVLPTKPLPNIPGTSTCRDCEKDFKDRVPLVEPVHETGISGLPNSLLSNKQSTKLPDITADRMHKRHEEIGVLFTEPLPDVKVTNKKKVVSDTLDWFFSPPKTCVLMEPSDKKRFSDVKRRDLSTPVNNSNKNKASGDKKLPGTPWNDLYMSATCTKKGETTLKRELWTRFEAISTSDVRLGTDIFQKNDGKGFLDLLDEASS